MKTQYPCDTCTRKFCPEKDCTPWYENYMERQELINGYAEKHGIEPIYLKMTENPCATCNVGYVCDEICPARAVWWDARMEWLKGVWEP